MLHLNNAMMDVLNEVIRQSAIGKVPIAFKNLVLMIFSTIVMTLLTMLMVLLIHGPEMTITFGY